MADSIFQYLNRYFGFDINLSLAKKILWFSLRAFTNICDMQEFNFVWKSVCVCTYAFVSRIENTVQKAFAIQRSTDFDRQT